MDWVVELDAEGHCDVLADRRIVLYDAIDIDEAERVVKQHDPSASGYTLVEPDGYRSQMVMGQRR